MPTRNNRSVIGSTPGGDAVSNILSVYGNDIDSIRAAIRGLKANQFKKGGIYIKPSHRGRFTELKERTGHSATWFKENGTPAQRKMATFALNARKWKHALGGPLLQQANIFGEGGDTSDEADNTPVWTTWPRFTVPGSEFRYVDKIPDEPDNPIPFGIDPSYLVPFVEGYTFGPAASSFRVRDNNSKTRELSEDFENRTYDLLHGNYLEGYRLIPSLHIFDIPYIPEKSILVNGSTVSTNVLDSLAKYAGIHNRNPQLSDKHISSETRPITLDEMLGLSAQESHNGAIPYFNFHNVSEAATEIGKERTRERNRAIANSNYLTAFGSIPAEFLMRNYQYSQANVDRSVPPILDAFQYYAQGDYNPGDPNHTSDVIRTGKAVWENPKVQEWWETSGKYWYDNPHGPVSKRYGGLLALPKDRKLYSYGGVIGKMVRSDRDALLDAVRKIRGNRFDYGGSTEKDAHMLQLWAANLGFMSSGDDVQSEDDGSVTLNDTFLSRLFKRRNAEDAGEETAGDVSIAEDAAVDELRRKRRREVIKLDKRRKSDSAAKPDGDYTNSEIQPIHVDDMIRKNIHNIDIEKLQKDGAEQYLRSLDTEQLLLKQREIADAGGYNQKLSGSKGYVKRLQIQLIQKGYLDGTKKSDGTYKEVDGIVGKKTQEAYNRYMADSNVDGVLGPKTINAYINTLGGKNGYSRDVSTKGIDGCAQWVTLKYEDAVGLVSLQNGVIGNAWTMIKNIEDKGGDIIYNIYDSDFDNAKTPGAVKSLTEKKLQQNPLDYGQVRVGDVVGIYIPSSNAFSSAINEGTTKNTHVGIVTAIGDDGIPIVEHNIHGSHRRDKITKLTGSVVGRARVTAVARPKNTGQSIGEIPIIEGDSRFKLDDKYTNDNMTRFMNAMEGMSNVVQRLYPDVDIDSAMLAAISPLKRETNFMTNTASSQSAASKVKQDIGNMVRKAKGMSVYTKSSNLSKMKLNSLTDSERQLVGIRKPEDLEDPLKAGAASLLLAARHQHYFNELAKRYPQLGLTNDDILNATILAYNQGMGRLKTLGFNSEGAAPEELELLRKLSDPDTLVRDVTSTNFRHLGKIGRPLYYMLRKPSMPYVGAARDAIKKYIKRTGEG